MFSKRLLRTIVPQNDKEKNKMVRFENRQSVDTATVVGSYLEINDLIQTSITSHRSFSLFNKSLIASKTKRLLQAVVHGNYDKVKKILLQTPALLLEKGTVIDYSGRIHQNKTAYQLALGACDFDIVDKNGNRMKGMVELIEEHFKALPGKSKAEIDQIMKDQYIAQYPDSYSEIEKNNNDSEALYQLIKVVKDIKDEACYDTSALENSISYLAKKSASEQADQFRSMIPLIIKAHSDEQFEKAFNVFKDYLLMHQLAPITFNFNLLKALYQFRNYLEPKEPHRQGKHFNYRLLIDAAKLYTQNYVEFGNNWNSPKNIFCWQKIIGYIERFVPACDAQQIAQGFKCVLNEEGEYIRTLQFRNSGGGNYFPLGSDANWSLGYNCAAPWHFSCGNPRWAQEADVEVSDLEYYVKQKEEQLPLLIDVSRPTI